MEPITVTPIGRVVGGRTEPRDDDWAQETATIELDASRFGPEALEGLADFSHVEVVFHFHLVDEADVETGPRHPRDNPDWPRVGIFAQRGRARPNRIGVSICPIERVEGTSVVVSRLDAVDGTPVLDLKPVMIEFNVLARMPRQPGWVSDLMRGYWQGTSPRREVAPGELYGVIDNEGDEGDFGSWPDVMLVEVTAVSDEHVSLWFMRAPDDRVPTDPVDPAGLPRIRLHDKLDGAIEVERDEFDRWDVEPVERAT